MTKEGHLGDPTAQPMDGAHLSAETLRRWSDLANRVQRVATHFDGEYTLRQFDYVHPLSLQRGVPTRLRKPYAVPVSYWDWGDPSKPIILCCGGVANTALRFAFFASQLRHHFRIICMDWLGRGLAGWLAHESEYQHETMVEQMRQMLVHLGARDVTVLGSSLGGSIAIDLAARQPQLVSRLILNDVGPFIPAERRQRRAETLSRFHVFRNPEDMTRRIGAAQKNDGPISDTIRLFISWQQTRWSNEDHGRIYRYDMRAMQAYADDARSDLDQWDAWARLKCPVLLVHGMESDALLPPTIERMQRTRPIEVMHVPNTGHTPVLSDCNQVHFIRDWLLRSATVASAWSVLHHAPRQPLSSGFS
jgi:pimeloyl-ACP methyl ester carboxylesterase